MSAAGAILETPSMMLPLPTPHIAAIGAAMLALGLAGAALAVTLPAARPETVTALRKYTSNACVPATAAALEAVGIPGEQVKSLSYYPSGGSADIGRTANRLDAYMSLTTSSGSVVVHHELDCTVITMYTSGAARLPRPFPR
jgi:hypothetical protein